MRFPVLVEARKGQFAASVAGVPKVRAVGPTRDRAIAALMSEIRQRIDRGELMTLEVEEGSVSSLAGKYADDPDLRAICDEAYHLRAADRRA